MTYKCIECGLEVEKIPKFLTHECGKDSLQHSFIPTGKLIPSKRFFSIKLEETSRVEGDDSTTVLKQINLTYKQMEKLLDDIPPTENTGKIKATIWEWF